MFWNNVFWALFLCCEVAIMVLLAAGEAYQYFIAGALMIPLAAAKLAEEARIKKEKKTILVKRSILRKLKKRR